VTDTLPSVSVDYDDAGTSMRIGMPVYYAVLIRFRRGEDADSKMVFLVSGTECAADARNQERRMVCSQCGFRILEDLYGVVAQPVSIDTDTIGILAAVILVADGDQDAITHRHLDSQ
jgi:hypothetical protein